MRAGIKGFHCPDIQDLEGYKPKEPDCFSFLLQLAVGPLDGPGEESFQVEVCTPAWLAKTFEESPIIMGRHFLIVREYDIQRILSFVDLYIKRCSGDNWEEIALKVGRLGLWEFEDYSE